METSALKIFLPAFMAVYLGTIAVWAHVRKTKHVRLSPPFGMIRKEIRLLDYFFKSLMLMVITIVMVFVFLPEHYHLTAPIQWLDTPFVNWTGVLTLMTGLVWSVVAQFNIERTIAWANAGVEEISFQKLVDYSQKLILTGKLIMFIGFFLTLSSAMSMLVAFISSLLIRRLQQADQRHIPC